MPTEIDLALRNASAALTRFLEADRRADTVGATLKGLPDDDPAQQDAWDRHGLALSERSAASAVLSATAAALGVSTDRPFGLARSGKVVVHGECYGCNAETWTIVDLECVLDLSGVPSPAALTQARADDLFRASPHADDLDDYEYDAEAEAHCYVLTDGRVVVIDREGTLTINAEGAEV